MEKEQKRVSVIIPVFNEAAAIPEFFAKLKPVLANSGWEHEIIAVDDGSKDESRAELEKIGQIKILSHAQNRGYGASLKTGIKAARHDWILIIDADNTYPVQAIPELLSWTKEYEQVIGARTKKNSAIPLERLHAKRFVNRYAAYIVGQPVPDLNSGLRVFQKSIAEKYWGLFPERFSFTSTLTMACLTHGHKTKFLPIDYYKRTGDSHLKPSHFFSFIKIISKLSLFFKPIKVFLPMSAFIFLGALAVLIAFLLGWTSRFWDTTFIVLCATALQTFFFGLLAEIIINNKN